MQVENDNFVFAFFQEWGRTIQLFLRPDVPIAPQVVPVHPNHTFFPQTNIQVGIANIGQVKFSFKERSGAGSLS